MRWSIAVFALALAITGCDESSANSDAAYEAAAAAEAVEAAEEGAEDSYYSEAQLAAEGAEAAANRALAAAEAAMDDSVEAGAEPSTTYQSNPSFMGYECTGDCSGHDAGYDWAEENGIDDPDDCGGNSQSFIEGCEAYGEEQAEESAGDEDEY